MSATAVQVCPILIAGPTGVGKSLISVELAKRIGGEIIGADAFQIYKGLAVLTAQPSEMLQQQVRHHMIGCLSITEGFDASKFIKQANALVAQIGAAGRVPILCGGTGLYLKAFTHGLDPAPPLNPTLREELNQLSVAELQRKLLALDENAGRSIDLKNPHRLIRAIEICSATGQSITLSRRCWNAPPRAHLGFLLLRDREELRKRIEKNVRALFEIGAVEEVARMRADAHPNARKTIGFELINAMLNGQLSREECILRCIHITWQYAKRQLTWFRNQTTFTRINMTEFSTIQEVVESIEKVVSKAADREKEVRSK